MFGDISHQCQLRKLQRKQKQISNAYKEKLKESTDAGSSDDEIESINHDRFLEGNLHIEEIEILQSRYLMNKSQQYVLSTPKFDEKNGDWEQLDMTWRWRLSLPAQEKVRSKIEKYENGRRERIHSWMRATGGIIGACTGLIGVVIGLIAIWR